MKKELKKPVYTDNDTKVWLYIGEGCTVGGDCSQTGDGCTVGNDCNNGTNC